MYRVSSGLRSKHVCRNPVCCLVNPFLGHEAEGIAPAEKRLKSNGNRRRCCKVFALHLSHRKKVIR